ncbi:MAG: hypothetical protein FVQ80_17490 [Planctomycetes bacterium]|nr:hypothetical protein [Planctomycetota bacterium]
MNVLNTKTKPAATLAIGQFLAREYHYYCPRCGFVVDSEELRGLVPERCNEARRWPVRSSGLEGIRPGPEVSFDKRFTPCGGG